MERECIESLHRWKAERDESAVRERVDEVSEELGHRMKILVGKPGLDGHSDGSEQVAL